MGSEMEQQPNANRPSYIERGGPVMEFRQARNAVMKRLDTARAAESDEVVRKLEEEAEVLW